MRYEKCKRIVIFSILLLIVIFFFSHDTTLQNPKKSDLYSDPPFVIDSDSDFISMGFSGSGNATSPYIISNYVIDVSGFLNDGILIQGTTKHFIIQNCSIYTDYIGIRVQNVAAGTAIIQNNTCIAKSNNGGGIGVNANGVLIVNNTCKNFAQGIHANQAFNIQIYNNSIYNSSYQGINIRYTSNSVISGNLIKDCREYAIAIVKSSSINNGVHSNVLEGNTYADSVNVDGIDRGAPHSQGFDEGHDNTWENNCWSDYKGKGGYAIDGSADSVDSHPMNCYNDHIIPGFIGISWIGVFIICLSFSYYSKRLSK